MAKKRSKGGKTGAKPKRKTESFRRTYREDYLKTNSVPSITEHVGKTFTILLKNYKLFLPFAVIMILCGILTIGTNGLVSQASSSIFAIIIGIMIWMVVIFMLRQILAGNKITLRGAMYNAFTALVPTVIMFVVVAVECLPIMLLVMASAAAVETSFLAMPFYALLFFAFALLMVLLSGYLLTSSLMALVAVSAPGLYPITALVAAFDLMRGQRMRFLIRLIVMVILMGVIGAIIIVPLQAIGIPSVAMAIVEMVLVCLGGIFVTAYLYLYYQWVIK